MKQPIVKRALLAVCLLSSSIAMFAQTLSEDSTQLIISDADIYEAYMQYADSVEKSLNYLPSGELISLGEELATLTVPEGFKYLNPEQSVTVLVDLWGNPTGEGTLGMLFREEASVMDSTAYAVNITYDEMGYVEDEDAEDLDYDELLETMQEDVAEASKQRVEMGYDPIELIGWASEPYYDAATKKLHWAKEIKFGESDAHTLNYNVRALGRQGVLELNFIAGIEALEEVKTDIPLIMPSVDFQEGNRYSDFNPEFDKVAAVGVGGLIAGKVLAKTGFFAILAKFSKVIIAAIVGFFALLRKRIFGGKKRDNSSTEDVASAKGDTPSDNA